MSARPLDDRSLVPPWRSLLAASALGELAPAGRPPERAWATRLHGRESREADFRARRARVFASDLVCSAIVLGVTPLSLEAARLLLADPLSSGLSRKAASSVIARAEDKPEASSQQDDTSVRWLRRRLREQPRNALRWAELSRLHLIGGNHSHARRAMRIALALAPEDRYVLRSAVRLAIHTKLPQVAHETLVRASRTPHEPWLLAAEIASATLAGRRSRNLRRAREMLASGYFSPHALSELASALGTVELESGSDRRARQMFRQALQAPTDNSVAQAEWAAQRLQSFEVDNRSLSMPTSWEARAWTAARINDPSTAIAETHSWQADEPFASRPAELGSYEAAKLGDFARAIDFARQGLIANPDEFLLHNNIAFSLLSLPDVDARSLADAHWHLKCIREAGLARQELATYRATQGLYYYRRGESLEGRRYYLESLRVAREPVNRALAAIMMAREELRLMLPGAAEAVLRADELRARAGRADLDRWAQQMRAPRRETTIRLTSSTGEEAHAILAPPRPHTPQGLSLGAPRPR